MVLLQKKVHGDASQAVRTRTYDVVQQIAGYNEAVKAMLTRDDIILLIQVQPGEDDQETRVKFTSNNRTAITITLFVNDNDPDYRLVENLLHELVLHAEAATEKHLAAVASKTAPKYPSSDNEDEIEAEEEAEHKDDRAWYRMADIVLHFGNQTFESAISDAASHDEDAAAKTLSRLAKANRITQQYAKELQEGLVDA